MNLMVVVPSFNNNYSIYFISLFFGFLIGSIPFGYIMARIRGIDIRTTGSKNIGFTNVNRIMGMFYAVPVLILDIAKGFLPTYFAKQLSFIPVIVGLGAVLGHVFTPWLRFRGGKGVATTIGVFLALAPIVLFCGIGVFILILSIFSYVSLASLGFAFSIPLFLYLIYPAQNMILWLGVTVAIIMFIRHKDNMIRLIQKTEPKISLLRLRKKQV